MKHRLPTAKTPRARTALEQTDLLADEKRLADTPGDDAFPAASLPASPPLASMPNTAETPFSDGATFPPGPGENADSDSVAPFSFLTEPEKSTLHETPEPTPDRPLVPPQPDNAETQGTAETTSILSHDDPPVVEKKRATPPPLPATASTQSADETSSILPHDDPPVVEKNRATPPPLPFIHAKKKGPPPLPTTRPETAHSLIRTRGLVKQYGGRRVVNGVDIHVRPGEVVGLLGRNGAGKTTTFYMIVGLVPPTEGHVYMGDEDVTLMPMYRRARLGIGYLPQEESIFRKLTVEENLLAILETLHLTEEERDARCDELLRDFGLEHVRENVAITLSGGEKRRVTIARALVTSPTLLLLDEPFSGVDPMAVHDIQEIIRHLKQRGLGVLITDHAVRETLSVVDRAYIIDEGRVLSEGSSEFVLNDPIAREIYLGHRFSM
jgi:lipopolysaccharide export system ATP-binding protein